MIKSGKKGGELNSEVKAAVERGVAVMDKHIMVTIADQTLTLFEQGRAVERYSVSTAFNGPGEMSGSGQTPRGHHVVRAKIGGEAPLNAVFVGRRLTGEIYTPELADQYPKRDWILTRILWLSGCEVGNNRLGERDSMRRYIYIHGTPDSEPMGEPLSHGCIRMRNTEVVGVYEWAPAGCSVLIQ